MNSSNSVSNVLNTGLNADISTADVNDKMGAKKIVKLYYLETKFEWLKSIRNPAFALPATLFPAIFYLFLVC
ncbi:hypothetical protein P4S73_20005 [Paraglaciecola sp. Hal342]